jgi:hypothetical protein
MKVEMTGQIFLKFFSTKFRKYLLSGFRVIKFLDRQKDGRRKRFEQAFRRNAKSPYSGSDRLFWGTYFVPPAFVSHYYQDHYHFPRQIRHC